jgi:hypothetical protein
VLQAVQDASQVFGILPVAEGYELQQRIQWQRRQREGGTSFDLRRNGVRNDMAEPGHVENESLLESQTPIWSDRFAEREDVHQSTVPMPHAMWQACTRKAIIAKLILQSLEVYETLDDHGYVGVVGHPRRSGVQKEFRHYGTDDSERDLELAQPSLQISDDWY